MREGRGTFALMLIIGVIFFLLLGQFFSGGKVKGDTLSELRQELAAYPEYTVILNDMRQEGTFLPHFYHQYKIVTGEAVAGKEALNYNQRLLEYESVSRETYSRYEPYLGMAILSKLPGGEVSATPMPPGYQYVGNPQYGQWVTNTSGQQVWQFFSTYLQLRLLMDLVSGPPIYRSGYRDFQREYRRGRAYLGPTVTSSSGRRSRTYGTSGSVTQKTHPTFFERQRQRQAQSSSSFNRRVQERMNRTGSGYSRGAPSSGRWGSNPRYGSPYSSPRYTPGGSSYRRGSGFGYGRSYSRSYRRYGRW